MIGRTISYPECLGRTRMLCSCFSEVGFTRRGIVGWGGVLIGGRGSNLRMRRDGVFPGENVSGSDAVDKSVCSLATGYDCNSHTMR